MRKQTLYLIAISILLALYVVVQVTRPKAINWNENFQKDSKSPYGCYILYDLLPSAFTRSTITENQQSLYSSLITKNNQKKSLLIITNDFSPDKTDFKALFNFIKAGNQVFIAAALWGKPFSDSTHISTDYQYPTNKNSSLSKYEFTNPHLTSKQLFAYQNIHEAYFSSLDTLKTEVLGRDLDKKINFIRMNIGKGELYLHSVPIVFTNYHILYSNSEYPLLALSYIKYPSIVWDEYYKPERVNRESSSPLRYILSQESFKYAYYTLIITLLLFMIFESKRRQRIMPIIETPRNLTLDFVQTIARLYFNNKNNKDLANKKIAQFYDFIHTNYYLRPDEHDPKFRKQFAGKLNIPLNEVDQIFDMISHLKHQEKVSDNELIKFVALIDQIQYPELANNQ
ncbi:MAG: DUF4350 domain-containing protein [Bacteroidota bacterium]|nr:DUF4350 domain-containing protein [Bacteroidota bacterium]